MAAAFALCAAPAHAATVEVRDLKIETGKGGPPAVATILYVGETGEANDLTVTLEGDRHTLTDLGAAVAVGRGCTRVDENRAVCTAERLAVALGDLDDRMKAPHAIVRAGPGDDVVDASGELAGEEGDDLLLGGPGPDRIDLGTGRDRALGRGGDDDFEDDVRPQADSGLAGDDVIDGGAGLDRVFYSRGAVPLLVDLAGGIGGEPSENDSLVSLEGTITTGGPGGRILGNAAKNDLHAFEQAFVAGGGGADLIRVESEKRDRVDGGSGDDVLELQGGTGVFDEPGARDVVRCGPGLDRVEDPGPNTIVAADCERAAFDSATAPFFRLPGRRARLGAPLVIAAGGECAELARRSCRKRLTVNEVLRDDPARVPRRGPRLAAATAVVTRDRRPRVALRPNERARRALAAGRCVLAVISFRELGEGGTGIVLFRFGARCPSPPLRAR